MIRLIFRLIKKPLLLLLALIIFIFLLNRFNVFKGLFSSKSLLIDNTPLVIKEIKTIAELNTATLFQEIVVDSTAPAAIIFSTKREIVLIIKGKITAGIDLTKLEDKNVFVKDDSVNIQLPAAIIRDVIINPSGIETFYEFGKWSNEEITLLKLSARNKLIAEAGRLNLLEKADRKARFVIEKFLKAAGFEKIVVWTK